MAEEPESAHASDAPEEGVMHARKRTFSPFTRRLFEVVLVVALSLLVWKISNVVILLFLSILLAIPLHMSAAAIHRSTSLPHSLALLVVVLVPFLLLGGGIWLFRGYLAEHTRQLGQQLQETIEQLQQHPWGQRVSEMAPGLEDLLAQGTGIFSQITGAASHVLDVLVGLLLVVFLCMYLASRPQLYQQGLIQLLPEQARSRAREALSVTGRALWFWLVAQFVTMIVVGILTWIGLSILGVPLAPLLALLTGVLEFVPVVGPIVASIPAILVGFAEGPRQALYVLILYIVVQQIESYIVMPLAQERGTTLSPALTLLAAVIFGILFGPLGIVVATPLMVAVFVLTKLLYIEGVLGSATNVPGRDS